MIPRMTAICKKLADGLTFKKILLILLGAMICTFGIHNIHQRTNITEGGVIGLMLLVEHFSGLYYPYAGCCLLFARIQIPGWELYQNLNYFNTVCFCIL